MDSLDYMDKVQKNLISQGTQYMRHYAPTALCCPARVSLWTGLLAHNHHVTDVSGPYGGWQEVLKQGLNDDYLPIWLQNHGYDTYYTGKLYNGMSEEPTREHLVKGWTEADFLIGGNTYQYWHPKFQHVAGTTKSGSNDFPDTYNTHMVANYSYGYIDKAVKGDKPFFIGIAPVTPHSQAGNKSNSGPPVPEPKYDGTLPNAKVPKAANFNPDDRSEVNFVWEVEQLNQSMVNKLHHYYERRVESLLTVDDIVEEVVDRLDKAGKLDDTYIIYSSDNGFHLGHHRLYAGKKYAFEEDINVPLIIRGPNIPKGKKTDLVSAHVDLAPTILQMAGIDISGHKFDGSPITITEADITNTTNASADEHTAVEFWGGASYRANNLKGIKVNAYKSLRLVGTSYNLMYSVQCKNNSHELYDMTADAVQMHNLHPTAPRPTNTSSVFGFPIHKLLTRIDSLLLVLKSCKGEECRRPWDQLHPAGGVKNLKDAMDAGFDAYYEGLPRVHYKFCFSNGTIDLGAEGPQWNGNRSMSVGTDDGGDFTNVEPVDERGDDFQFDLVDDWE